MIIFIFSPSLPFCGVHALTLQIFSLSSMLAKKIPVMCPRVNCSQSDGVCDSFSTWYRITAFIETRQETITSTNRDCAAQ